MYVVGENPLLSEPDLHHADKAARPARLPRRPGPLHARDGRARPTSSCRPAAFARRKARSRTRNGACSAFAPRCRRPARRGPTGGSRASSPERVARRLGRDVGSQFDYAGPGEIFDEMARLWPFLAGLSHARLDREGGIQWRCLPGPPGHALPLRGIVPEGARAFRPGAPARRGRRAAGRRLPFVLNTRRPPLSLARAERSPGASRGCWSWRRIWSGDPSERRAASRHRDGLRASALESRRGELVGYGA